MVESPEVIILEHRPVLRVDTFVTENAVDDAKVIFPASMSASIPSWITRWRG
jgi:hypothetical protein